MNTRAAIFLLIGLLFSCTSSSNDADSRTKPADSLSISGEFHFFHGYQAFSPDSSVNVVIEIPAGSVDKWEVNKQSGKLEWPVKDGKRRTVDYFPYPANYGMIPQTLSSAASGGDGDPLDVFVLGPSMKRGAVIPCKIIGVIKLMDGNEQDDKLIAVANDSPLENLRNLDELAELYPEAITILKIWLANYKGQGIVKIEDIENSSVARKVLLDAIGDYHKSR